MLRLHSLLLLVPFLPSIMTAASPEIIPLWDGTPPNHRPSSDSEVVEEQDGIIKISKVQTPTIEVRLPARPNATGKAVVVCPGGGYSILAYNWEGTDIASLLNANGIAAIILKYRLPDDASNIEPRKTPLLDAKRAMRIARARADDWGYAPDQIGIMGFSAGGHLASTLGTRFDAGDPDADDPIERLSSRPDFQILIYPVITMRADYTHAGSRARLLGDNPSEELILHYSNELQVTADAPPTFIVHSSDDQAVPVQNSLAFYEVLLANDVSAEMHLYPYGGHGYSLAINRGRLRDWSARCIAWIKELP